MNIRIYSHQKNDMNMIRTNICTGKYSNIFQYPNIRRTLLQTWTHGNTKMHLEHYESSLQSGFQVDTLVSGSRSAIGRLCIHGNMHRITKTKSTEYTGDSLHMGPEGYFIATKKSKETALQDLSWVFW